MKAPFRFERAVRFEEVDAAGLVFFARYLHICHEVMEAFFHDVEGTYSGLITRRRIGVPAVDVHVQYKAPLRYGDVIEVEVDVPHLGTSSATLRYAFRRKADNVLATVVRHTVVCCHLDSMKSIPFPDDVRAVLQAHLNPDVPAAPT